MIANLLKLLSSKIGWLGGSLAVITAILSALGFLVIRSYHDLLGVGGVIPINPESWTIEGARFLYNSLFYLIGRVLSVSRVTLIIGISILIPVALRWISKRADMYARLKSPAVKGMLIGGSFLLVLLTIQAFAAREAVQDLLVKPQTYDTEFVNRSTTQNMVSLRNEYAFLTSLAVLLFVWMAILPHMLDIHVAAESAGDSTAAKDDAPTVRLSIWQISILCLWTLALIPAIYLPMTYGKLTKSNDFFRVQLIKSHEQSSLNSPEYQGWLLYKDANEIILFTWPETSSTQEERIRIFKRGDFAQIRFLELENIFSRK